VLRSAYPGARLREWLVCVAVMQETDAAPRAAILTLQTPSGRRTREAVSLRTCSPKPERKPWWSTQ